MTKVRTEILIESSESYVVTRRRLFHRKWCNECGRDVNMVSPSEAAFMTCQTTEIITSLLNENQIHHANAESETPLVCLRSLSLL